MSSVFDLRAYCLSLAGAEETYPWTDAVAVMKVGGKAFAFISNLPDRPQVSLKCDPDEAVALREQYAAVIPGYHLNKQHWNTVILDGSVPNDELTGFVEDSWRLVVAGLSKPKRLALLAEADGAV